MKTERSLLVLFFFLRTERDAVKRFEGVFGDLRYKNVTALPEENPISIAESVASPTGFEPVLPH